MIKKSLTYQDLEGKYATEDFYFALSMSDILETAVDDKAVAELLELAKGADKAKVMSTFTNLVGRSVGRRGAMGLVKSPEFSSEFMNSDAFNVLMWEILTDAKKAAEFLNGIMPADISKKLADSGMLELSEVTQEKPLEQYTRAELLGMDTAEFERLVGNNPTKMTHEHLTIAFMRKSAGK